MALFNSLSQAVGNTPLLELKNSKKKYDFGASVFAKLEFFNPAGSVKDRVALNMIETAEQNGTLKSGGTIIEPTSGNTGIGIAAICAAKGYKAVIVMPDTMSIERRKLIASYGAEVVLTDGSKGMNGAIAKAEELNRQTPNSIIAGQFYNPANPDAHYKTTAPEIYNDLGGKVDAVVCGIGSGGTITGIGRYLKEKVKNIKIIGVEPLSSPFLTTGKAGAHKIQGIGAGFVPENLDTKIYDELITVSDNDAISFAKELAKNEGLSVGISSGAAFCAAVEIAKREDMQGKNIVVILPDGGSRYLSTELFDM
ncbi:MAG: cysteine synthase A [Clostridia bacterium]|nr:cysteine synthase A [Clostridia bacterium]